jgi:parallel beta-helix repeat protein
MWGLFIGSGSDNLVKGNTIARNTSPGITNYALDTTIDGNTLTQNTTAIETYSSSTNIVGNTIRANTFGITMGDSGNHSVTGNVIRDQLSYGIALGNTSNSSITGNTFSGNGNGGSVPSVMFTNSSNNIFFFE